MDLTKTNVSLIKLNLPVIVFSKVACPSDDRIICDAKYVCYVDLVDLFTAFWASDQAILPYLFLLFLRYPVYLSSDTSQNCIYCRIGDL